MRVDSWHSACWQPALCSQCGGQLRCSSFQRRHRDACRCRRVRGHRLVDGSADGKRRAGLFVRSGTACALLTRLQAVTANALATDYARFPAAVRLRIPGIPNWWPTVTCVLVCPALCRWRRPCTALATSELGASPDGRARRTAHVPPGGIGYRSRAKLVERINRARLPCGTRCEGRDSVHARTLLCLRSTSRTFRRSTSTRSSAATRHGPPNHHRGRMGGHDRPVGQPLTGGGVTYAWNGQGLWLSRSR